MGGYFRVFANAGSAFAAEASRPLGKPSLFVNLLGVGQAVSLWKPVAKSCLFGSRWTGRVCLEAGSQVVSVW
jgi:hypothetical protein